MLLPILGQPIHSVAKNNNNLVPHERIELPHPDYKTGPLPLRIIGQYLVLTVGFEPTHSTRQ